jgi:hypothetical protein
MSPFFPTSFALERAGRQDRFCSRLPTLSRLIAGLPIGTPYVLVGRPINVPDKIGIPYVLVGRNLFRLEQSG